MAAPAPTSSLDDEMGAKFILVLDADQEMAFIQNYVKFQNKMTRRRSFYNMK